MVQGVEKCMYNTTRCAFLRPDIVQLKCDGTRWLTGGEVKVKLANGVGSQYSSHYLGTWVYPALLPLVRTPRLPVVDWTDASADLNGLVCFAERWNLVSARVLSHFKRSLLLQELVFRAIFWTLNLQHSKGKQVLAFLCCLYVICVYMYVCIEQWRFTGSVRFYDNTPWLRLSHFLRWYGRK
jgi:hypothetical protein